MDVRIGRVGWDGGAFAEHAGQFYKPADRPDRHLVAGNERDWNCGGTPFGKPTNEVVRHLVTEAQTELLKE